MKKFAISLLAFCLFIMFGLTACNSDDHKINNTDDTNQIFYLPYEIEKPVA